MDSHKSIYDNKIFKKLMIIDLIILVLFLSAYGIKKVIDSYEENKAAFLYIKLLEYHIDHETMENVIEKSFEFDSYYEYGFKHYESYLDGSIYE